MVAVGVDLENEEITQAEGPEESGEPGPLRIWTSLLGLYYKGI